MLVGLAPFDATLPAPDTMSGKQTADECSWITALFESEQLREVSLNRELKHGSPGPYGLRRRNDPCEFDSSPKP